MCTPNGNGFYGEAMYQTQFCVRNKRENGLMEVTKSRFFGSCEDSASCNLIGNSVSLPPHGYMGCTNNGSSPTSTANQNIIPATPFPLAVNTAAVSIITPTAVIPPASQGSTSAVVTPLSQQLQRQAVLVVKLADGQPISCIPVRQLVLASPAPLNPASMLTSEISQRSNSHSSGVSSPAEGGPRGAGEGVISPLKSTVFLGEQTINTSRDPSFSVVLPVTRVSSKPLSFAHHLSATPLAQNGNNVLPPELDNITKSDFDNRNPSPTNNKGAVSIKHQSDVAGDDLRVDVYSSDFSCIISLSPSAIFHKPHPSLGVSRLVLCRKYFPGRSDSCWKGAMCKFVHADTTGAPRNSIHVNYSWRSVERCTYPRLPAGEMIDVLAPNGRKPLETFPSERILVTRGSINWKSHIGPLSRCAHYYFNCLCNRGEKCNFIHTVCVNLSMRAEFKRAPASRTIPPTKKRASRVKSFASTRSDVAANAYASMSKKKPVLMQPSRGHNNILSEDFNIAGAMVPTANQDLELAIPQQATDPFSRTLLSVLEGSARSSSSEETRPIEWAFVDTSEDSILSDGEAALQLP
ncbi:hypothetical protein MOQ_004973 [Trypanosoma cruzi marinkellei]|uniref:C3H1-type domain-containing protein n=1 Tax=Trypanosoma cruzi marinkellei TaxID=85056 RepID=K2MZK7_TRYCR|nr:hypothetical protein MOQ_004973 [Trypanosoma cruzi marinkellei]